ncbi:cell wall hydrolase [Candidatus Woesebacteria bacterium]|nr:cell wall hydrolase [Candidatus Woesebacteria bacterium]
MFLVYQDQQKRQIQGREEIKYSSFSSFHLIILTARAKSKKQTQGNPSDHESLTIEIDGKLYPKLADPKDTLDSPAAFPGSKLSNLTKTLYVLTFLKGKNHHVTLTTHKPQDTATFERLEVYTLNLDQELTIQVENQAEDGDRRPWVTIVLDRLPLLSVIPRITYARRKRDSDDIKIIIDGKTQTNLLGSIKHFLWRYVGSRLPWVSPTKTEAETFTVNLSQGLHYLEFWADRMPIVKILTINFGTKPSFPEGIPTVDNPKWTGDFYDDTEDILLARLIFGEAENQPRDAKIGVGFTVINRVKKQRSNWGLTNREVILKEGQYNALWDPDRRIKVRDPLNNADEATRQAWQESYEVAKGTLNNSLTDTTSGATHFHSYTQQKDFPSWATEKNFKVKLGNIYFYELDA